MMLKRMLSVFLALALTLTLLPANAMALGSSLGETNHEAVATTAEESYVPEADWLPDNDELFARYVEKELFGPLTEDIGFLGEQNPAGNKLTGVNKKVYDTLKAWISDVASGKVSSTIKTIPVGETGLQLEWTLEDLKKMNPAITVLDESTIDAAFDAVLKASGYDLSAITEALLVDCPYELYWYDKTQGCTTAGPGISYTRSEMTFTGNMTFTFQVAKDYQAGNSTTVRSNVSRAAAARENATAIVNGVPAGTSDYDRLLAYKDKICELVSYDNDAVKNDYKPTYGYGDPWQLIRVFDNTAEHAEGTTPAQKNAKKVVCEGYAKAFQYLCDLTNASKLFKDEVDCYIITGYMSGGTGAGGHMWNHVKIGEKYYLVDVTNCDDGSIGNPDYLFMVGGEPDTSGTVLGTLTSGGEVVFTYKSNYAFTPLNQATVRYSFDKDANLWNAEVLTLATENYQSTTQKEKLEDKIVVSITTVDGAPGDKVDAGTVLTATVDGTDGTAGIPEGMELAYQWYRNGNPIPNAIEAAYKVTTDDSAAELTVAVSEKNGTYSGTVRPAPTNTVWAKKFLTQDMVQISPESFDYNGKRQRAQVTVTDDTQPLTVGTDYEVEYSGDQIGVNTVCVTVTGIGEYGGEVMVSYQIVKATPDLGTVSVTSPGTIYVLTGIDGITLSRTNPSVPGTLKLDTDQALTVGTRDYSYTFTPSDTDNYETVKGTVSITVSERKVSGIEVATFPTTTYEYEKPFEPGTLELTVSYEDHGTANVKYPDEGITFKLNDAEWSDFNLGDVGTKNVTVFYGGASADISVTVTAQPVDLTSITWNASEAKTYNGEAQSVALKGGIPVIFDVAKEGDTATDAGTYTAVATLTLKGGLNANNYKITGATQVGSEAKWTISASWTIGKGTWESKTISKPVKCSDVTPQSVDLSSSIPGDCGKFTETPAVTASGDSIFTDSPTINGSSLTFTLANHVTAGQTATLTIPIKTQNYSDFNVVVTVTIKDKSVVTPVVTAATDLVYNGKAKTDREIVLNVTNEDGYEGEYVYAYSPAEVKNAGTYTVTVSVPEEDTEYAGSRMESFTIAPAPVTITPKSCTVTAGDALPVFEYEVEGLIGEDKLTTVPMLACETANTNTAGTYEVTASGAAAGENYEITYAAGTLTVNPIASPTADPAGLAFTDSVDVTLSCETEGATIYYTLDKTEPSADSTAYTTPITLTDDTTIKAVAGKNGQLSAVAEFSYTKQTVTPPPVVDPDPPVVQTAAAPAINPNGGIFYGTQQIVLTTATPGAIIYYTTDGSIPTTSSTAYVGTFTLYDSATVMAIAVVPGMNDSAVASAVFTRCTYTPSYPDPDPEPDPEPDDAYEPPAGNTGSSPNNTPVAPQPATPQPTTPPQPVQQPAVPEAAIRPEAAVSGDTASAILTGDEAEKLVEQAVNGRSETVVIAPVISGDVTKTEVILPASAVNTLANQTSAELKVETPVADITILNESLAGLGGQGGEIAVTAEKIENNAVEVAVTMDGQRVEKAAIKATIPTPCGPGTVAKIVDENGNLLSIVRKSIASSDGQTMNVPLDGSAKVIFVENSKAFADVPATSWAADAVAFASSHELMNGTGGESFEPAATMTRAMLAVVLHNLEGNPVAVSASSFNDVASGSWYTEAVEWAAGKGVINGVSEGVFAPESPITREQLILMLYRYVGKPAASGSALGRFIDSANVSDWAAEAMNWAVSSGVVNGSNGALNPQSSATRAEVAQMMMNFVSSGIL